uniref:Uncharacterized protein n=1 Tax=Globodera rostochiensis TaxID=31243 RepID=A0A914HAB7_GLORO
MAAYPGDPLVDALQHLLRGNTRLHTIIANVSSEYYLVHLRNCAFRVSRSFGLNLADPPYPPHTHDMFFTQLERMCNHFSENNNIPSEISAVGTLLFDLARKAEHYVTAEHYAPAAPP